VFFPVKEGKKQPFGYAYMGSIPIRVAVSGRRKVEKRSNGNHGIFFFRIKKELTNGTTPRRTDEKGTPPGLRGGGKKGNTGKESFK